MALVSTRRTGRVLLAGVLLLAACSAVEASPMVQPPPATPAPTEPPPTSEPSIAWHDPDLAVPLSGGWTLRDCEGDAPLRCFHGPDGVAAGSLEFSRYEARFAPGRPSDAAALRALVVDLEAWLVEDRATGCPGHDVILQPVSETRVAGRAAVVRGHRLDDAAGTTVEQTLGVYIADGDDLVLLTVTATTPDGCTASDLLELTPDQLGRLAPQLVALITRSQLPA